MVRDCLDIYKFQIDRKKIMIVLDLKKDLEINFVQGIINFIVRNILSNAVKFSNVGGRIEISTRTDNSLFEFEVKDNGIGMSVERINQIFRDADISSLGGTSGEIGSGIGLKLCQEYIIKLNGDLIIRSQKGKGSKFTVKLPM
jgi:signal transduction histidine kinase